MVGGGGGIFVLHEFLLFALVVYKFSKADLGEGYGIAVFPNFRLGISVFAIF